jgi:Flp pilus assembly protein TadD
LAEKAPLLALAALASVLTLRAQQGVVQTVESFPLESRLANAVISCVRYLGKLAWPVDLAVFYPYRERSFGSPELWGALALLAALSAVVFALRHRGYPPMGWLWFLGTMVPVLGLVQVGIQSMADRYTYIPSIGVLWAGVWGLTELVEQGSRSGGAGVRRAAVAASIGLLALLGHLTWRQSLHWRDDEALFTRAVEVTRDSYWARYNLGLTLLNAGRANEAVANLEEAVRLVPSSREALVNLGVALEATQRAEEAISAFRRATAIPPPDRFAARHLSRALVSNGRPAEADGVLEDALGRWPEDPQLHYSRGLAGILVDRPSAAIEPLSRASDLDPGYAAAHNALGIALARTGDRAGAIEHFERAVELEPDYHEARDNLARLQASVAPPG